MDAKKLFADLDRQDWTALSNCLGADPRLFFPERGEPTKEAKAVCNACEVRMKCLDYSMERNEKFGIWGGFSERERRRMRRGRRMSA